MRDIKFRAWDNRPKAKCMLDWFTINQTAFNFNCNTPLLWTVMHDPDIIRLQYTGLKDKNGKELFFDDVVDIRYGQSIAERTCIDSLDALVTLYNDQSELGALFEIVGNIHENPHLLETPQASVPTE